MKSAFSHFVALVVAMVYTGLELNAQVVHEWSIQNGGSSSDAISSINHTSNNDIILVGTYQNTVDFDPGPGLNEHTSYNLRDVYIQKLDEWGNAYWTKTFGSMGPDFGMGTLDQNQNILITGTFSGGTDFDPGPNVEQNYPLSENSFYILKLDSNGGFEWVRVFGSPVISPNMYVGGIQADENGNIYVTGTFSETIDFDPGTPVESLTAGTGTDGFLVKYDPNGNFQWVKRWGVTGRVRMDEFEIHGSKMILTGVFSSTIDLDPNGGSTTSSLLNNDDYMVIELDTSGIFQWGKNFGGDSDDNVLALDIDIDNNIYLGGSFLGDVDFDPGPDSTILNGTNGLFIHKLDSIGNFKWVRATGGLSQVNQIVSDRYGNVFAAGDFRYTVDLDVGPGLQEMTSNNTDIYLMKLDSAGNFNWAFTVSGVGHDYSHGLMLDTALNLYQMTYTDGSIDVDPNPQSFIVNSNGGYDGVLTKYQQGWLSTVEHQTMEIIVYPNPSTSQITISGDELNGSCVELTNIQGKSVWSRKMNQSSVVIDLNISPGAYLLKVTNEGRILQKRIVLY